MFKTETALCLEGYIQQNYKLDKALIQVSALKISEKVISRTEGHIKASMNSIQCTWIWCLGSEPTAAFKSAYSKGMNNYVDGTELDEKHYRIVRASPENTGTEIMFCIGMLSAEP